MALDLHGKRGVTRTPACPHGSHECHDTHGLGWAGHDMSGAAPSEVLHLKLNVIVSVRDEREMRDGWCIQSESESKCAPIVSLRKVEDEPHAHTSTTTHMDSDCHVMT